MVIIWPLRSVLIKSTIAESVVDFPDPVGPVTNIKPFFNLAKFFNTGGNPKLAKDCISAGIARNTAPIPS